MTRRERQAREYAAETDAFPKLSDDAMAAWIAEFLRERGFSRAAACVISWKADAAKLRSQRQATQTIRGEVVS